MSSLPTGPLRTTPLDTTFGLNVARKRTALNMSQASLVALLSRTTGWEWARKTLGKIEMGTRPVRLTEAYALADALNTTIDELSGRTSRVTAQSPLLMAQLGENRRMMTILRSRERALIAEMQNPTAVSTVRKQA